MYGELLMLHPPMPPFAVLRRVTFVELSRVHPRTQS